MHVIECSSPGGPEVLKWAERPVPVPAADEVLIRVASAGLNRADLLQRQGKYPPPEGASDIMGLEVSGEVVAVGKDVSRWKIGDKLCALLAGGGYAEYVSVPARQCLPVPAGISMDEAAALPEALATIWANIFKTGGLQPHETVLVHGGSSGIGTLAILLVKKYGAKIFVTAGSDEKTDACRHIGADLAINYKTQDFIEVIDRETAGKGIDVILDMVGGDYVPRNLSLLRPGGRHVSIATQKGRQATINMLQVIQRRLTVTGSTVRGRSKEEKAVLMKEVEEKLWPWIAAGGIKPLIYKKFPIKQAMQAHKMMESGVHIGKIILEVAS